MPVQILPPQSPVVYGPLPKVLLPGELHNQRPSSMPELLEHTIDIRQVRLFGGPQDRQKLRLRANQEDIEIQGTLYRKSKHKDAEGRPVFASIGQEGALELNK